MTTKPSVDWGTILLCLSLCLLGYATWLNGGHYTRAAVASMAGAVLACWLSLWFWGRPLPAGFPIRNLSPLVGVVVTVNLILQGLRLPAIYLSLTRYEQLLPFVSMVIALAILTASLLSPRPWLGRWHAGVVLALLAMMGTWIVAHTPDPAIDTYIIHQESSAALLRGENPYSLNIPNIYGPDTPYYPKSYMVGDRMLFGYTYPPVSLLMVTPAHAILGDHRLGFLICMLAAAALLLVIRPGVSGAAALAAFATFPRTYQIVESSWTEPVLLLLLGGCVLAAIHGQRVLPLLFGLLLVSKQYMLLFAPAALLLLRPWTLRRLAAFSAVALAVAAATTLPFALWDWSGFFRGVIALHLAGPPRWDALSVPSFAHDVRWGNVPGAISSIAILGTYVLAAYRAPRSPAGFAMTVAAASLALFFFQRGHLNYYYFSYGAMCFALAARANE